MKKGGDWKKKKKTDSAALEKGKTEEEPKLTREQRAQKRRERRDDKRIRREIRLQEYRATVLRKRQKTTSIYFLVWAAFAVLSLVLVLVFGVSQQMMMVHSYKSEASQSVAEKGKKIERLVSNPPLEMQGYMSSYVRMLATEHGVRVVILSLKGDVVYPQGNFDSSDSTEEYYDFSDEWTLLNKKLGDTVAYAVYEEGGEYVYGSRIQMYGVSMYLYVGQSMELMETALADMTVRVALTAIFVFVLTFVVSSAVSGFLTRPLSEMTRKAHRLAQGDFDMDFHGDDYGREMVELADALNYARDELSKTDRMQKELIANVSHDFKTPLTMIKAYASMIIEISGDVPEKRNKHAQVIVDEADRLASLVNDVLDLSKIRSGIENLQLTDVDMSACVHEILGRFGYLKETQGYKFVADVDEGLYAHVDELKIGQVLYNLIGNAVNYTGEDKTVLVRLKKEGVGVFRFSVTDTGKGIKPEEIGDIWDRYYRSSEAHKRPVKGTGLGLSIVKTILERHGLRFGVDSEVGKGSTFYVLFPLIDEPKEDV